MDFTKVFSPAVISPAMSLVGLESLSSADPSSDESSAQSAMDVEKPAPSATKRTKSMPNSGDLVPLPDSSDLSEEGG